jgi:hypothetical protein
MNAQHSVTRADRDIVTREYRDDTQLHRYRSAHINDDRYRYVIPLCEEAEMYPDRHPRDLVAVNHLEGGYLDRCSACDVAVRRVLRSARQVAQ